MVIQCGVSFSQRSLLQLVPMVIGFSLWTITDTACRISRIQHSSTTRSVRKRPWPLSSCGSWTWPMSSLWYKTVVGRLASLPPRRKLNVLKASSLPIVGSPKRSRSPMARRTRTSSFTTGVWIISSMRGTFSSLGTTVSMAPVALLMPGNWIRTPSKRNHWLGWC